MRDVGRDRALVRYEHDLRNRMAASPASLIQMRRELRELVGKPLACWCRRSDQERTPDTACHGDVLVALIHDLGLEPEE